MSADILAALIDVSAVALGFVLAGLILWLISRHFDRQNARRRKPVAWMHTATPPGWDASQIKQPGWQHVEAAFIEGAREARANPDAGEYDFRRAADGYTKRVFEEIDPESERRLRTGDFA